jgi:hypothetical protein
LLRGQGRVELHIPAAKKTFTGRSQSSLTKSSNICNAAASVSFENFNVDFFSTNASKLGLKFLSIISLSPIMIAFRRSAEIRSQVNSKGSGHRKMYSRASRKLKSNEKGRLGLRRTEDCWGGEGAGEGWGGLGRAWEGWGLLGIAGEGWRGLGKDETYETSSCLSSRTVTLAPLPYGRCLCKKINIGKNQGERRSEKKGKINEG